MSRDLNTDPPLYRRLLPRLTVFIVLAILLVMAIACVSPAQLPVVVYKLALITLAGVVAYWLDRVLFPYARPGDYLLLDWRAGGAGGAHAVDFPITEGYERLFIAACVRRAIIVAGVVLAVAMGL